MSCVYFVNYVPDSFRRRSQIPLRAVNTLSSLVLDRARLVAVAALAKLHRNRPDDGIRQTPGQLEM
jgi:hypothetical protein